MILTCPQCATRYEIATAQIGAQGRSVRCAACKHVWTATADSPIELEPEARLETEPEAPAPGVPKPETPKAREIPRLYRSRLEDMKRLEMLKSQGVIWGIMAASLIALIAVGYVLRVDIVRTFPNVANAYALAGINVNATGMKFVDNAIHITPELKGGRFVVSIEADVVNLKDEVNAVPPLRAQLLDAQGAVIGTRLIPVYGMMIDAHATRHLSFYVEDPKNLTDQIDLRFDLAALKDMARLKKLNALYRHASEREAGEKAARAARAAQKAAVQARAQADAQARILAQSETSSEATASAQLTSDPAAQSRSSGAPLMSFLPASDARIENRSGLRPAH